MSPIEPKILIVSMSLSFLMKMSPFTPSPPSVIVPSLPFMVIVSTSSPFFTMMSPFMPPAPPT